jgi:hypothetical protein
VQDNISLILLLVFYLASTHLDRDTQRQIHWSVNGPRGSETSTFGAPGRGLLRVDKYFPVEFQMGSLQQPLQPGMVLRFGSFKFMSRDGSYSHTRFLEGKPNANHVRARISYSRTQQLHNMDIITQCSKWY